MFTAENSGSHKRTDKKVSKHPNPEQGRWFLDPGIILLAAGVGVAFGLVLLSFIFPSEASSSVRSQSKIFIKPSQVREGSVLFKDSKSGKYIQAPRLYTKVKIAVTGMIGYVRVIQEFENPGDEWLEGVYIFPLPEDSAVSHLTMDVGDRVIEGIIQEREEAKKIYNEAKNKGRKASLLEQERPNIFTMSIANIGPREVIRVELEYQQTVKLDNGAFSIRFPTVVAPRYIPGKETTTGRGFDESELQGWTFATPEVPDAPRITPPVVEPGQDIDNPVFLEVILDPGFNLKSLKSLYHAIDANNEDDGKVTVHLSNTWAVADQDFVLEWIPEESNTPQAALFTEKKQGENFVYLMVMPPAEEVTSSYHIQREVIFVVDVSGSMAGASIRQAKEALTQAILRITPDDRFNVITFNDRVCRFFDDPVIGTKNYIRKALQLVRELKTEGGTEIKSAMSAALDGGTHPGMIRQVVFITDGCVGNEQELFQIVRERLGDSRIFTIGIGSAPNSYFMRNIATRGKGTFTYIGDVEEVKSRMAALFKKLENPLLTDVRLSLPTGNDVEMFPYPIPDLYLGEPVTLVAKIYDLPDQFVLSGYYGGEFRQKEINTKPAGESLGISTLWARTKIKALMDSLDGGADRDQVKENVIATALKHHLVSRYTSLVAVDVTPSRPAYEQTNGKIVKTNIPKGWQYTSAVRLAQTATVADLCFVLGSIALLLSLVIWLLLAWERGSHAEK